MNQLKPIEHIIKKPIPAFLKMFGRVRNFAPAMLKDGKIRKIIFIRPQKIGDIFIVFPVFDSLRKHFPDIKISILGSPECEPIIKFDPRFHKIYIYRKNFLTDIRTIKKIRAEKYDCAVDLVGNDSVSSLLLTALVSPGKPRIAVGKDQFRPMYDLNYDLRYNNTGHVIANTLKLLAAFGIDHEKASGYAPPFIDAVAAQKASEFLNSMIADGRKRFIIGYNLSAGSSERVPSDHVSLGLTRKLLEQSDSNLIVLFALGNDRVKAEQISKGLPDRIRLISDKMTLMEASAVISRLDFFISPDTSLVHIARSFGVPVVAIYRRYQDNFKIWHPFDQTGGAVVSNNYDNIADIGADDIYSEYLKVLNSFQEKKCPISRS